MSSLPHLNRGNDRPRAAHEACVSVSVPATQSLLLRFAEPARHCNLCRHRQARDIRTWLCDACASTWISDRLGSTNPTTRVNVRERRPSTRRTGNW